MAKYLSNNVFDNGLAWVKANVVKVVACSAQPTTYVEATTTYALADVTVTTTNFTIANATPNGRKITLDAQNNVTVDTPGTMTHLAWCSAAGLEAVTTSTSKALVDLVNIPAHTLTLPQPT